MCTENQNTVIICSGGVGITGISLWIKWVLVHRGGYAQISGPLINGAKAALSTELRSLVFVY